MVEVLHAKSASIGVAYTLGSLLGGLVLVWSGFRLARLLSG